MFDFFTLLEPRSRLGDKPLEFEVVCPHRRDREFEVVCPHRRDRAVPEGLRLNTTGPSVERESGKQYSLFRQGYDTTDDDSYYGGP